MDNIIRDLDKLKKGIDDAKTQVAILQSKREEALNRLKNEYNLNSVEAAEKWIAKAEKDLDKAEAEIKELYDKLKKEYDW